MGCSIPGCTAGHEGHGLCKNHLARARNWRQLPDIPPCGFPGCDRGARSRGLCEAHYKQWQRGVQLRPVRPHTPRVGDVCSGPDCRIPVYSGGLCRRHYQTNRVGRDLAPTRQPRRLFCSTGCGRLVFARRVCWTHYRRLTAGQVDWDRPIRDYADRFGPVPDLPTLAAAATPDGK